MNKSGYHPFWSSLYQDRQRQFWYLQALGWLGLSLLSFLSLTLWYNQITLPYVAHTLVQSALGLVLSLPLRHIFRLLWDKPQGMRVLLALASVVAVSLLWTVLRMVTFMWMTPEQGLWPDFGGWLFPSLFVFMCWAALYHGIKYYQLFQDEHETTLELEASHKEEQLRLSRAENLARQSQLAMLRYQLNPHFLFNTLNAIAALVGVGENDRARRMVVHLSDFLRYSLQSDPVQLVSLQEEMQVLQYYLEIQETRFGNRLQVQWQVPPDVRKALMPSLLLQPLLENAIKYGVASNEQGGTIIVSAESRAGRLCLSVADEGPGLGGAEAQDQQGAGVGLPNIRERLATLYDNEFSLTQRANAAGGLTVLIELPLKWQDSLEERAIA
jgi:two-component system LytT family sensor kinase